MLAQSSLGGVPALYEQLRSGLSWWAGELCAMIPKRVRAFFDVMNSAIEIVVLPAEIMIIRRTGQRSVTVARIVRDALAPEMLSKSIPRESRLTSWISDPIVLRVISNGILERDVELPRSARRDLPHIMRHEVSRQSPVDAASIYYDYRATSDTIGLHVSLRMVRRDDVDAALAMCHAAGVAPSAITFGDDDHTADGGNAPVSPQVASTHRNRRMLVPRLALAAALLAILFVSAIFLRGQWLLDDLSQRIATAQAAATNVEHLERQLAMAERGAKLLSQQKRDPATVQVLAEVTRLLPDGAWLYEFEMSHGEVRIHGFARAAASLIALFDASPLFRDAQFRSPLMQGPGNDLDRFDMSFKLNGVR